jgi:hypothetical protein
MHAGDTRIVAGFYNKISAIEASICVLLYLEFV